MARNSFAVALGFFTVAWAVTSLAQPETKPLTYRELIAARPAPDLTTLVERSSPEIQGDAASESFMDLLKLRNSPNPEAVPVLEKVLIENLPTGRIHRFAAAQALFSIGTTEAHQILAQQVLAKERRTGMAVDYTSHWEMQEPLRSRYIERYLLQNLSKDLVIEVKQLPVEPQSKSRVDLVVTFRNVSDEAFHVRDHKTFPGEMVFLRDAMGQYLPRLHDRTMCMDQTKLIELAPGQAHSVNVTIDATSVDPQKRSRGRTGQLRANVVESGHSYDIAAPGRFEVVALIEAEPLTNEVRHALKVGQDWKLWTGRAVSKPVPISIMPVQADGSKD